MAAKRRRTASFRIEPEFEGLFWRTEYYEVNPFPGPECVRGPWGRMGADVVLMDCHGYAVRDRAGAVVTRDDMEALWWKHVVAALPHSDEYADIGPNSGSMWFFDKMFEYCDLNRAPEVLDGSSTS